MAAQVGEWMGGWMNETMGGWMDARVMDGRTDRWVMDK